MKLTEWNHKSIGCHKGPKIRNDIIYITVWNLLNDMLNLTKHEKNKSSHLSLILHGWIKNRKGKEFLKQLWVLLDSGYSFTIIVVFIP